MTAWLIKSFLLCLLNVAARSVLVAALRRHHAQAPSRDPLSNRAPDHATLLGSLEALGQGGPPKHWRGRLCEPARSHAGVGAASCCADPDGNCPAACIRRRYDRGALCRGDERCPDHVDGVCQRQPLCFHRELTRNDDAFVCRTHPGHCSHGGCVQGKDFGPGRHCQLAGAEWTKHQYGNRRRGIFPRAAGGG